MPRLRILIATIWAGSLWTIGYLVAPTLFSTLSDRKLAGSIAGQLFRIEAWLSLACAAALLCSLLYAANGIAGDKHGAGQRKTLIVLICAMAACTLLGYFGLQPFMAALRETAGSAMDSDVRTRFGILHGLSSAIYLVQSMLGVLLIIKIR